MKPNFRLKVNDQDITEHIVDRLVQLRYVNTNDTISDYMELELDDRDHGLPLKKTGPLFTLWLGYGDKDSLSLCGSFTYDDVSLEGPPSRMTLRATASNFYSDFKTPVTRSYDNISLEELVKGIATLHGYEYRVAPELASTIVLHIDQNSEPDSALLQRLAEKYDATFKAINHCLVFLPKAQGKSSVTRKPLPVIELTPLDVSRWQVSLTDLMNFDAVRTYYNDKALAQRISVTAGTGKRVYEISSPFDSKEEAERNAKARLARYQRNKRSLSLSVPGDPRYAAEGRILLKDFRDGVNGAWSITRVDHVLNDRGYQCRLTGEWVS